MNIDPHLPIDSTAKNVVYNKKNKLGATYLVGNNIQSLVPLPIKIYNGKQDLSGYKTGRIEVIGYFGNSKWVVRCQCGRYCVKKGRNIKNRSTKNSDQMCDDCYKIKILRKEADFLTKNIDLK